jgi:RNA polymerase sigma-70 factor, ECF subfamily
MRGFVLDTKQILQLLERARGGDRNAFEALVSPLRDELLQRIRLKMGASLREKLEPEDVLQEVQLRALRSISKFRWQGEGSLEAWLEGIAANFILTSAKTRRRRREFQVDREPCALDVTPSRQERRKERFERLKKSVEELPPDYRTAVRLSRLEGLRIREIAERMGRSPSAVKNLLFKAMKKLQESFGDTESLGLPDRHLGETEADHER